MSDRITVPRGLDGVIVDTTSVSMVHSIEKKLIYRGYYVDQLAERFSYDQVSYLLIYGDLPNDKQLEQFIQLEKSKRPLGKILESMIDLIPVDAHPMDATRSIISIIGSLDSRHFDNDVAESIDKFMDVYAKLPIAIARFYRRRKRLSPLQSNDNLDRTSNFFHICFDENIQEDIIKAFDVSMILYAEHSFNASTFTCRVIASTKSDIYSALVGGVSALKGPLHGGANEQVMYFLQEIGELTNVTTYIENKLSKKELIMGFGHRVYKDGDSRVPLMNKFRNKVSTLTGNTKWIEISDAVEQIMYERKGLFPNLDFPAGPCYFMMGFPIDFFTPFFVMSRISGWTAHFIEQTNNNKLIRPLSQYIGNEARNI